MKRASNSWNGTARLLQELLWLGGAALFAWFFLKSFLVIEGLSAVATLALWGLEQAVQRTSP